MDRAPYTPPEPTPVGPAKEPHESDPRMFTADGVLITDGLVVLDYNYDIVTVDFERSRITREYWDGWFRTSNGSLMDGSRLTTTDPKTRQKVRLPDGPPSHDEVIEFMNALDRGSNFFGPLDAEARARLYAVLDKPNQDTWVDAHGIILRGMTTVWQALLKHTDYDVTSGPSYAAGETPGPWPKLPTSDQLLIAIRAELS